MSEGAIAIDPNAHPICTGPYLCGFCQRALVRALRVGRLEAELASAHRRIRHLRARAAYWRAQATGYGDSKSEREGRRKR